MSRDEKPGDPLLYTASRCRPPHGRWLSEKLKAVTGNFEPVYTRCEDGRKRILKCRKRSYITFNEKAMRKNTRCLIGIKNYDILKGLCHRRDARFLY